MAKAAIAAGADGIMVEVHNKPLEALSDGQESLYPNEFVQLVKDIEKKLSTKLPAPSPARPDWIPVLGRTAAGITGFWDQTALPDPKQAVVQIDELVEKYTGRAIVSGVEYTLDHSYKILRENIIYNNLTVFPLLYFWILIVCTLMNLILKFLFKS